MKNKFVHVNGIRLHYLDFDGAGDRFRKSARHIYCERFDENGIERPHDVNLSVSPPKKAAAENCCRFFEH